MDDGPDYRQQEECEAEQWEQDYAAQQRYSIEQIIQRMEHQLPAFRKMVRGQNEGL